MLLLNLNSYIHCLRYTFLSKFVIASFGGNFVSQKLKTLYLAVTVWAVTCIWFGVISYRLAPPLPFLFRALGIV